MFYNHNIKMKKKKNIYLENSDILTELTEFRKKGIVSEELGIMIVKIANNYSKLGSFSGYTWREDMVSEAVLTCIKYLHNFNPDKSSNPFSYITTICKNAFINYITKQKKHSNIKDICFKNKDIFNETGYVEKAINYERIIE